MACTVDYSQHSGATGRFIVKEILHFNDGTIGEHCTKETSALLTKFHEEPIVNNFGLWTVPASSRYLQSWQDINPSIRNVTFSYQRIS